MGFTHDGRPVLAQELKAPGPMAALMRDAVHPNLVQTLEGTPAFVHAGPFGNIATGTSSVIATRLALKLADYVITEAGFASDLGAEKFFDIKCRVGGLEPSAAVLVATVRALKLHGGAPPVLEELQKEDVGAVERGLPNLEKHIENVRTFGLPLVVAINRFSTDTDAEIDAIRRFCESQGVEVAVSEVYERGGEGGLDLAEKALALADSGKARFRFLYEADEPLAQKIERIATRIYGADGVKYTATAKRKLDRLERLGYGGSLVCMAKTQDSLSDDPQLRGRPRGFTVTVRDVYISAGAGFVVPLAGQILTMPGLPKQPAAEGIDVDDEGNITGIF